MKVLVFGSVNIDRTFTLPRFPERGETILSSSVSIHAGGKGANQAVALSKAGADVSLASTIGEDGIWIKEILSSYGVDTSLMNVKKDTFTGTAAILLDEKKCSSIILYGGGNRENSVEYIKTVLSEYKEGDWIVLQNEINNMELIMNEAAKKGLRICLNPSPFEYSLMNLPLEKVSLMVLNEVEISQLAGIRIEDDLEEYKKVLIDESRKYPSTSILLTLGENGSLYKEAEKETIIYTPSKKVEAVDTTAAGDTFLGYFLALTLENQNPENALETATKASALTVTRPGAMEAIPTRKELGE